MNELEKKLDRLIMKNLDETQPTNLLIELEELEKKGFTQQQIRKSLKETFGLYIDDYGLVRKIIMFK